MGVPVSAIHEEGPDTGRQFIVAERLTEGD